MNTNEKLLSKLKNKEYRDSFVASYIDQGIPFQIRVMREQRHWSQERLAKEAGMKQEAISRIENPNNKSLTIKTIKQLASAFDVGVILRYVPVSSMVEWVDNLPDGTLEVISYTDDPYFQPKNNEGDVTADSNRIPIQNTIQAAVSQVVAIVGHLTKESEKSGSQKIPTRAASKA
jgi:transcriptional regulator with XRE-family HTH domain